MKDKLIAYVDLLFSGVADADDVKQEILQNTLDRYDDLLSQGKSPEAAYTLSIAGIGDISELLSSSFEKPQATTAQPENEPAPSKTPIKKKILDAIAICLYILCPLPLLVLHNELGLCGLLALVAIATGLLILNGGKKDTNEDKKDDEHPTPAKQMRKAIHSTVSVAGLCCYFIISFLTGAWHITWLIFPIMGAVKGLINAYLDMKEDQ